MSKAWLSSAVIVLSDEHDKMLLQMSRFQIEVALGLIVGEFRMIMHLSSSPSSVLKCRPALALVVPKQRHNAQRLNIERTLEVSVPRLQPAEPSKLGVLAHLGPI